MNENAEPEVETKAQFALRVAGMIVFVLYLLAAAVYFFGLFLVSTGNGTISETVWMPVPGTEGFAGMGFPVWMALAFLFVLPVVIPEAARVGRALERRVEEFESRRAAARGEAHVGTDIPTS